MTQAKRKLFTQDLAYGGILGCWDSSRPMVADRWLVVVDCRATISMPSGGPDLLGPEDEPWLAACIRQHLGDSLIFAVSREKPFVAEEEKEAMVGELLSRILDTMLPYLDNPAFPQRLLEQRYRELRLRCLAERGASPLDHVEEDSGPADFSDLFRDPTQKGSCSPG